MEMELRAEIFPDDLDATVSFYTAVLGFTVTADQRTEPSAYVSLRRGSVRIGAARRAVPDRLAGRLTMSPVSGTGWSRRDGRWRKTFRIVPGA
jgi:catechol 2,3-dioxygenase-like lactoylglutathione lyase family enzyme